MFCDLGITIQAKVTLHICTFVQPQTLVCAGEGKQGYNCRNDHNRESDVRSSWALYLAFLSPTCLWHIPSVLQTDMLSHSLVILPRMYLEAVVVILIMVISQIPAIRHLNHLNLATVLDEQTT